jgi:hypothetical protein
MPRGNEIMDFRRCHRASPRQLDEGVTRGLPRWTAAVGLNATYLDSYGSLQFI